MQSLHRIFHSHLTLNPLLTKLGTVYVTSIPCALEPSNKSITVSVHENNIPVGLFTIIDRLIKDISNPLNYYNLLRLYIFLLSFFLCCLFSPNVRFTTQTPKGQMPVGGATDC